MERRNPGIPSPCVGLCRLESGVCIGCARDVDEITRWYNMTENEKERVIQRITKGS